MTAQTDRYGLPLSTSSPTAAEHYVDAVDRVLRFAVGAEETFQAAVAADEGFALAHADLAFTLNLRGSNEAAKPVIDRARQLVAGCTRREAQHVEAIAAAVEGDASRSLVLVKEHLAEFPRDPILAYLSTALISNSGRPRWPYERLALFEQLAPAYGDDWWFLGYYSFVNQEVDNFDLARRLGERSLELEPRNAGASHSVAHVFYETADVNGGAAFLDGWLPTYEARAPFHCHLSWHLALFELARGRYGRALEVYDRGVRPSVTAVAPSRSRLPDSAAFLWRCNMFYGQCALPWDEVRDLAAQLTAKLGATFADLHAALAYTGAGDQTAMDGLIDGLRALAARGHAVTAEVALPLALGIRAFGEGDYASAIRHIEPVFDQIERVGGSEAQREVFEDTLLLAYLRAERYDAAERILRQRLDRLASPRDLVWLTQAQAALGEPEAVATLRQAEPLWRDADPDAPERETLRRAAAAVA